MPKSNRYFWNLIFNLYIYGDLFNLNSLKKTFSRIYWSYSIDLGQSFLFACLIDFWFDLMCNNSWLMFQVMCGQHMKTEKMKLLQSFLTLCNLMDRSLPGSSVHGIFQARTLGWVAISFSSGPSRPRDRTWSPSLQAKSLPFEPRCCCCCCCC